jgi:hypothetical protein
MKKVIYAFLVSIAMLLVVPLSSYAGRPGAHAGGHVSTGYPGGRGYHGGGNSSYHGGGNSSYHGGGNGSYHGGWNGSYHGGWHGPYYGGWHGPYHTWGWGTTVVLGPFWYPYPYYQAAPVIVQQPPAVYAQPEPQQDNYWYYCPNPQGYYPYIKSCPGGWMKVVPEVTPPNQ